MNSHKKGQNSRLEVEIAETKVLETTEAHKNQKFKQNCKMNRGTFISTNMFFNFSGA
jgi:hypothetical protein